MDNWTEVLYCDGCGASLVRFDPDRLLAKHPHDSIASNDFRSADPHRGNPQDGDRLNCHVCGRGYLDTLRRVWKEIKEGRYELVGEWDR